MSASELKGVNSKKSFIMKFEQNMTLHKNILLPQTYSSLIKFDNNLNM